MRKCFWALLVLVLPVVVSGQIQKEQLQQHPTLKIVGFQFLAYEGGGIVDNWAGGPAVTNVAGAMSLGVSPLNATGNGSVIYTSAGSRGFPLPSERGPFSCIAVMTLHNAGNKTIRAIHLDYIFRNKASSEEFLRYQFRAKAKIRPGTTRKLKQRIYQRAGKYRDAFLPIRPTPELALKTRESVTHLVVNRIEYSDGTIWSSEK